ncbi:hypothetical protein AADZ90_010175 [Aestuariibius sp. 2305UL40-4]|uniref:hypothetical protein n=1 Tax=Aestuariibius violaceus TaxID=3234132 RepID=UPI00345E70A1
MSAPDTDVEKQEKRHKGPLIGIAAAVAFGVGLIVLLSVIVVSRGDEPVGADEQIDGRTGTVEEVSQ